MKTTTTILLLSISNIIFGQSKTITQIEYRPSLSTKDSITTCIALHVSSLHRGDSTIMTAKESFIWSSKITSREEYDFWVKQFHFNNDYCKRKVEVRVSENWILREYTFKEFGDLIFPRVGGK